jgi:hypothetical protein
MDGDCSEVAPAEPVVCGGVTCAPPTESSVNPCVVACCVEMGGVAMCGAKSTLPAVPAACTLPAVPDPSCPAVLGFLDLLGTPGMLPGCCNVALGKCGVVSRVRPGCITESAVSQIPDRSCGGSADGGLDDAGP